MAKNTEEYPITGDCFEYDGKMYDCSYAIKRDTKLIIQEAETSHKDSFDNLSQMDQQFLNPTALNFREVGPQIDANYDDAFRTGEVEKIAYKLGGEDNSEPIREVPVGRYAMEAIYSATGKPLSFSDKIKNAVIKAEVEKYNSNRDPEEFAFSQQAHNLYNSARDNYYQNDSNFNDTVSSNLESRDCRAILRKYDNLSDCINKVKNILDER